MQTACFALKRANGLSKAGAHHEPRSPKERKMNFHGEVEEGSFGQLSSGQLSAWVSSKITSRNVSESNIKQCVNYAMDHAGAGGGGTRYTYKGSTVFHISHGQMGSNSGCTLFFANMGNGNGTIVAIGWHRGTTSYDLDWCKSGWHNGVLDL
jgi:hypothetical protein